MDSSVNFSVSSNLVKSFSNNQLGDVLKVHVMRGITKQFQSKTSETCADILSKCSCALINTNLLSSRAELTPTGKLGSPSKDKDDL